uniref:pyruvate, phosphate dikinase n=1 Tax=Heterosiphonia pulchra TaxID=189631 RepID=A0A097IU40_9FLOR|nr:pyruvate orthophosphate dikinase [Heterosiphonia pulchra]
MYTKPAFNAAVPLGRPTTLPLSRCSSRPTLQASASQPPSSESPSSSIRRPIGRTIPLIKPASSPTTSSDAVDVPVEPRYLYSFRPGHSDATHPTAALLGGKGCALATMSQMSLPVPPGFILSTSLCARLTSSSSSNSSSTTATPILFPDSLTSQIETALAALSDSVGRVFGSATNPLLLSVRSGAPVSMPGMMDTVLNLGLNDKTVEALAKQTDNAIFAYDSYRRFLSMYANVVLSLPNALFEKSLSDMKSQYDCATDADLPLKALKQLVNKFKHHILSETGIPFEQDVFVQLRNTIAAVFQSWQNPRAQTYRAINHIPMSLGTAVVVQAMVFGNSGPTSATGVFFSRDPSTGVNKLYGEFLTNAQGEDVVAGIRTPQPIVRVTNVEGLSKKNSMQEVMPDVYKQVVDVSNLLEQHFKDVQDVEFTVEKGTLYILQTRAAKRTALAAVRSAVEMEGEGLISKDEALKRVDPKSLRQLLHPTLDSDVERDVVATGLPASPGAASGVVALSCNSAEFFAQQGLDVILCREETSPEDVAGMHISKGIVTARGGMTSHAAVVARGMGRACITGVSSMTIDEEKGVVKLDENVSVKEGDCVTIDGATGQVMLGKLETKPAQMCEEFKTLMQWADQRRDMTVLANAETPEDVRRALSLGAEGVGLCRTEHMFFDADRIVAVRQMILAEDNEVRTDALNKLLPMQRQDFTEILEVMQGRPVTIRLLDPPLHEFLPHEQHEFEAVARSAGVSVDVLKARADASREANPMLGLRGCRVGIVYPEIYRMQTQAIVLAAVDVARKSDKVVCVHVMVPFVSSVDELEIVRREIDNVASTILSSSENEEVAHLVQYTVGTMIELPRAALTAGEIARQASFFSFGTNDLTQTTLGMSRDDAGSFLQNYLKSGVIDRDPFVSLDIEGVGMLVELAAKEGRKTRKDLKLCLCGEQGADKDTVVFAQKIGLDAVSCSPFFVPVARLAAAQAAIVQQEIRDDATSGGASTGSM